MAGLVGRRQLLTAAGATWAGGRLLSGRASAADAGSARFPASGSAAGARPSQAVAGCSPGQLREIRHIVILVQENRGFDHYFGSYQGVRGYDDRSAPRGRAAFEQAYRSPSGGTGYPDPMLPFHLSTAVSPPPRQGECTNDIEHQWAGQHDSWHRGGCDNWMNSHLATEPDPRQAAITMGYYTRADLAFYYTLADHFTICDNYYCSVIGGTDINRLYAMTGTLDPDGWDGGCTFLNTKLGTVQDPGANLGTGGRWTPYPQVLSRAGISWKIYSTPDGHAGDNILRYFPQYRPVTGTSSLSIPAFGSNAFPADFAADCQSGQLPEVSWLLANLADTEHAPSPPEWGESIVHTVLAALTTSPEWASTVLFVTYDENGGFFDHVPPPTAPPGTPGEYLDQRALTPACRADATTVHGADLSRDPIGLGFRVPMLVVSPFSRNPHPGDGPLVCSDRLDHTSLLRFIESWSAAVGRPARIPARDPIRRQPGLSPWRRAAVGDLTGAFSFAAAPDASVPTAVLSVVPNRADPRVLTECIVTGTLGSLATQTEPIVQDPVIPTAIPFPAQERSSGPVRRPATGCAPVPAPGPTPGSAPPPAASGTAGGRTAPGTGSLAATGGFAHPWLTAAVGAAAAALLALRRRLDAPPS